MEEEMKFDLKELHEAEEKNGRKFDFVRMSLADLNGISRTSVVPRKHLENYLLNGISTYSGRLLYSTDGKGCFTKEVLELNTGNAQCVPCKGTLHNCSWVALRQGGEEEDQKVKWQVGEVLCEMKWPLHYKEGSFMQACPRYALRKQLNTLQELGFHLMSAFELEYCLLDAEGMEGVYKPANSHLTLLQSKFEDYMFTIGKNLSKANVDISNLLIENGEAKFEIVMAPKYGIETCDDAFVAREAIKEISDSMGYIATFMCYPYDNFPTQGAHLNLSLWTQTSDGERKNAFYDANDPHKMSNVFRHFLAGLIKHGKALCAFWCPTVNCYRRLKVRLFCPKLDWGFDNRKSSFRVKQGQQYSTYLESRVPSSACNPYLVTAATLVAGIDGIRNQTPLPEACEDLFDPTKGRKSREEVKDPLPESLEEALDELQKDEVLKEGLGEELLRWFVDLKKKEVQAASSLDDEALYDLERMMYLKI